MNKEIMESFVHECGQVYESCDPYRKAHLYLIIDMIDRGKGTARVSAPGCWGGRNRNRRLRTIKLSSLHRTGVTRTGARRVTGWRLIREAPKPGQVMCVGCFYHFDGHNLDARYHCQACAKELKEQFPGAFPDDEQQAGGLS